MEIRSGDTYVQINIIRRSYPNSSDYWDGNWLESEIKINASGFKSLHRTNLRADDFQRFYEGLIRLNSNFIKEVEFTTMEEGLYLKGQVDVAGNVKWKGVAQLELGGNSLMFFMETGNISIGNLVKQVKDILDKYPVIGDIS